MYLVRLNRNGDKWENFTTTFDIRCAHIVAFNEVCYHFAKETEVIDMETGEVLKHYING